MNRLATMFSLVLLLIATKSATSQADELIVPVLQEPWFIVANVPTLDVFQGDFSGAAYRYQGVSADGFNISCFVEKPANDHAGHEAVYENYWPQAKRNPLIVQDTVQMSKDTRFVKVTYEIKSDVRLRNANYYIAHEGKWIDLHVSLTENLSVEQRDKFNKIVADFENSLKFLPTASLRDNATAAKEQ